MTNIVYNKNGIPFDIDALATDVNGKLDRDCLNYSDTGYSVMASAGMPSNTYIDLTLGASGTTYTAPANGYFTILMDAVNNTTLGVGMAVSVSRVGFTTIIPANNNLQGNNFGGFVPVKKGNAVTVAYQGTTSAYRFRFVYAVGSESEAN